MAPKARVKNKTRTSVRGGHDAAAGGAITQLQPPLDSSEHAVGVGGGVGDDLQHVPMLDDLAVVGQAEDVDAGVVRVAGPLLEAMQDDELPSASTRLNSTRLPGYSRAMRSK